MTDRLSANGPLALGPIEAQRVSDVIAERLTRAIQDGMLQPGDRLPSEQELAREFGVGRTSVREGLQKLRAHGLIESRKGLGAFVAAPRPADPLADFARWTRGKPRAIEELVEGRFALEVMGAALAAVRATPEHVAALTEHERAHAAAGERNDLAAVVAADEAFHEGIMAAAGNHFLRLLYAALMPELADFRRKTLALPWAVERSVKGHDAILAAIRGGDPVAARAAMIDHLWVLYAEVHDSATAGSEGNHELPILSRDALS